MSSTVPAHSGTLPTDSVTDRPMFTLFGATESTASEVALHQHAVSPGQSSNSVAPGGFGVMGSASLTGYDSSVQKPPVSPGSTQYTPANSVATLPPGGVMMVTDPLSRKLAIPLEHIRPTQATTRPGVPSLCLLFLDGRCRQALQCHQIHAEPSVVLRLRQEAKSLPTCCHTHGDVHANRMRPEWLSRTLQFDNVAVPVNAVAYSNALERLLASDPSDIVRCTPQQLCRLHGSERCRFTEDCRFIHICRDLLRAHFADVVPDLIPQLELRHKHRHSGSPAAGAGAPPAYGARAPPQAPRHDDSAQPQIVVLPDGRLAQVLASAPAPQPQAMQPLAFTGVNPPNNGVPIMVAQPPQQQHGQRLPMQGNGQSGPVFIQVAGPTPGILGHAPMQQQQHPQQQQQQQMWIVPSPADQNQQPAMPQAWQ